MKFSANELWQLLGIEEDMHTPTQRFECRYTAAVPQYSSGTRTGTGTTSVACQNGDRRSQVHRRRSFGDPHDFVLG